METSKQAKRNLLRKQNVLHPHPETVTAPLFHNSPFFDPQDLIQVKYEMLRTVIEEHTTIRQAAQQAGLSRPAFYQAQSNFQQAGLTGLIPQKTGPRGAHKLTVPVVEFLQQLRTVQPQLSFSDLAQRARKKFAVEIHPRTIQRVLMRQQKKR
jgi:transposase-like protein